MTHTVVGGNLQQEGSVNMTKDKLRDILCSLPVINRDHIVTVEMGEKGESIGQGIHAYFHPLPPDEGRLIEWISEIYKKDNIPESGSGQCWEADKITGKVARLMLQIYEKLGEWCCVFDEDGYIVDNFSDIDNNKCYYLIDDMCEDEPGGFGYSIDIEVSMYD